MSTKRQITYKANVEFERIADEIGKLHAGADLPDELIVSMYILYKAMTDRVGFRNPLKRTIQRAGVTPKPRAGSHPPTPLVKALFTSAGRPLIFSSISRYAACVTYAFAKDLSADQLSERLANNTKEYFSRAVRRRNVLEHIKERRQSGAASSRSSNDVSRLETRPRHRMSMIRTLGSNQVWKL